MASAASREERQQMRLRGAGSRKVKDVNFGFSFGAAIPSQPAQPSPLRPPTPPAQQQQQQQPSPLNPAVPHVATPNKQSTSTLRRSPSLRRTPGSGGLARIPQGAAVYDIPPDNEPESEQRSAKRRRISAFSRIQHEGPESSPTTRQMVTDVMSTLEPMEGQRAVQTLKAVEIPTSPPTLAQSPDQASQTPPASSKPSRSEPLPIEIVPETPVQEDTAVEPKQSSKKQASPPPNKPQSKPVRRKKRKSVVLIPRRKKKRQSSPLPRVEDDVVSSPGHNEAGTAEAVEVPQATENTTTTKPKQSRKKRRSIVQRPAKRKAKKKDVAPEETETTGIVEEGNTTTRRQSNEHTPDVGGVVESVPEEEAQDQSQEDTEVRSASPAVHDQVEPEYAPSSQAELEQQPKRRRRKISEEEQPPPGNPQLGEKEVRGQEQEPEPEPEPEPEVEREEGTLSTNSGRKGKEKKKQRTTGSTVPVTVHRLANASALEPIPEEDEEVSPDPDTSTKTTARNVPALPVRSGVNAPDVLSQICQETLEKTLSTLESAIERESNRARRTEWARKRKAVESFGNELENRLFEISELSDGNYGLAMRLRKEKKEYATLRNRLMDIRKQREEVGVRMDEVRKKFNEDESVRMEHGNVNNALHDLQLAVDRSQKSSSKGRDETGEANPFAGLEFLLRSVAQDVSSTASGSEGGLLKQVQAFNARLEEVADTL